jgi:hypothetical protein
MHSLASFKSLWKLGCYIRETLLEPGLGTGHVRCQDLTWVKTRRSDMFGPGIGYVRETSLEPGDPVR